MAQKKPNSPKPPTRAPERIRSNRDLREFQRLMMQAVTRPLGPGDRMKRTWEDGRATKEVVGTFSRDNDRMSGVERLEIYNRMYWFRTLDSLYEDLPGLRAVLGERVFMRLIETYLVKVPSRSYTLRDLPSRLEEFIRANRKLTAPHTSLAADMVAFEWSQIECFDGATRPIMTPNDLADTPPAKLKMDLQPQLRLLVLRYPVDDYAMALKENGMRAEASNAVESASATSRPTKRVRRPKPKRTYLAVHRHEGSLYFKSLELASYRMLTAIREGKTLPQAVAAAGPRVSATKVQEWFTNWMHLGWFCLRK